MGGRVQEIDLGSWSEFHERIGDPMFGTARFVWRGQREANWQLRSGLDRLLEKMSKNAIAAAAEKHLERFKLASRGRRGQNPNQPKNDNEWWALAQHNAMLTPLLDWTESPFVALYFAFEKDRAPTSGRRAVWGLSESAVTAGLDEEPAPENVLVPIRGPRKSAPLSGSLEFIRPMQDDNSRLVSQAGLFTRVPAAVAIEDWIGLNTSENAPIAGLIKITMPNDGRIDCLRSLNRMNINHLSLFPDLYGAGKHCNNALEIGFD
jgi:hypothetical protein